MGRSRQPGPTLKTRKLSIATTFALLPAAALLMAHRSLLAFVYLASFLVTLVYHASVETRLRRTDHALAYAVIASNTWMAFHARVSGWAGLGIVFVLAALPAYFDAKGDQEGYDRSHAAWHFLSGCAGLCFAIGYVS